MNFSGSLAVLHDAKPAQPIAAEAVSDALAASLGSIWGMFPLCALALQ